MDKIITSFAEDGANFRFTVSPPLLTFLPAVNPLIVRIRVRNRATSCMHQLARAAMTHLLLLLLALLGAWYCKYRHLAGQHSYCKQLLIIIPPLISSVVECDQLYKLIIFSCTT